jgi:cysteinyl-tRNA synthetase
MHNGFVTVNGEKMSKSIGNIILVRDLSEDYHGEVIRLALLSSHYRQGLDWNEKVIHQSKKLLDKLYKILDDLKSVNAEDNNQEANEIIAPLFDDLNSPGLIANLNKLIKDFSLINNQDKPLFKSKLILIGKVLGILEHDTSNWFISELSESLDVKKIEDLISSRLKAKSEKDYKVADAIRQELLDMGVEIKDTDTGTDWNPKA